MSVYGYPREPETGGETAPTEASHDRVVSRPVSVPPAPPPAPLLPPDPPGFAYGTTPFPADPPRTHPPAYPTPSADPHPDMSGRIPPQRQPSGRVQVPDWAPVATPPAGPPASPDTGWHSPAGQGEPAGGFGWLRPATSADQTPAGQAPADYAPADHAPADQGGSQWAPAPAWDPPLDQNSAQDEYTARDERTATESMARGGPGAATTDSGLPRRFPTTASRAVFGPSPSAGQPAVPTGSGLAESSLGPDAQSRGQGPGHRAGFGPSPSMGQPAVAFGLPTASPDAAVVPAEAGAPEWPADSAPQASPEWPADAAPLEFADRALGEDPAMAAPDHTEPTDRTVTAAADLAGASSVAGLAWGQPAEDPGPTLPVSIPKHDVPIPVPLTDAPAIPPWDSKPLLIVIASVAVLVLIGIVSGVVSAAVASTPAATWRAPGSQPTPDPATSPTDPAAPPPGGDSTVTFSSVGDVIMGSENLGVPPDGGAGFFDPVRDALAADLVMGNLDMALSDPTGFAKCSPGATDCFQLSLPPSYANVLRDGGFQLMSLANNHTQDQGAQGYANTQGALEAAGIQHTGGVDQITYVTVKDTNVAVLGFSVYSYTANLNDIPRAVSLVQQATSQADLVVVQMQGGAEGTDKTSVPPAGTHEDFFGEDRGDLRGFAHAVIDAGADVVFGHGPHVMRGMEFYQGRLIAYSLGNFCGYRVLASGGWSGVGGILKVTLNRDGTWAGGQLIASEMVGPGTPAIDAELRALGFVDDLSVRDFGGAAARIDRTTGTITVPL